MKFIKAETNGNDFVIINEREAIFTVSEKRKIANRNFGVGCDQLIFVQKDQGTYSVDFFNQDGSRADMCGNGTCAVAKYINRTLNEKSESIALTVSGKLYKTLISEEGVTVSFEMPQQSGNVIFTGNKHFITKFADIEKVEELAREYPECNLHFIDLVSHDTIRIKTFERGVGWTLACGSGAVAVGVYSKIKGKIKIIHDGGESIIEILRDCVTLTTSPRLVFKGELYE